MMKIRIRGQEPEQETIVELWLRDGGNGTVFVVAVTKDACCELLQIHPNGVRFCTNVNSVLGFPTGRLSKLEIAPYPELATQPPVCDATDGKEAEHGRPGASPGGA